MKAFRKYIKRIFPIVAIILVAGLILTRVFSPSDSVPAPLGTISDEEAHEYVGKVMEVCGEVSSTRFLTEIDGQPTFLNFGDPHPIQVFTAVIWGADRVKWQIQPESAYLNQKICVTGIIDMHRGTPQIEVKNPGQIRRAD